MYGFHDFLFFVDLILINRHLNRVKNSTDMIIKNVEYARVYICEGVWVLVGEFTCSSFACLKYRTNWYINTVK